ncbi:MAG: hypothetical protein ABJH45_26900 [Paracoccaceae bacterium]
MTRVIDRILNIPRVEAKLGDVPHRSFFRIAAIFTTCLFAAAAKGGRRLEAVFRTCTAFAFDIGLSFGPTPVAADARDGATG